MSRRLDRITTHLRKSILKHLRAQGLASDNAKSFSRTPTSATSTSTSPQNSGKNPQPPRSITRTDRHRETSPPNALRSQLAQSQNAGPHPDADLLTAFAENTLLDRERAGILAHLAACPTCRAILSTAANAEPEVTPEPRPTRPPIPTWLPGFALAASLLVMGASTVLFYRTIHTIPRTQTAASAPPPLPAAPPRTPHRKSPPPPVQPASHCSTQTSPQSSHATPPAAAPTLRAEEALLGAAAPPPPPPPPASSGMSLGDLSCKKPKTPRSPETGRTARSKPNSAQIPAYRGTMAESESGSPPPRRGHRIRPGRIRQHDERGPANYAPGRRIYRRPRPPSPLPHHRHRPDRALHPTQCLATRPHRSLSEVPHSLHRRPRRLGGWRSPPPLPLHRQRPHVDRSPAPRDRRPYPRPRPHPPRHPAKLTVEADNGATWTTTNAGTTWQ